MKDPEIIKKQIENVQTAGDYWWKKPWPFSVMFMIVCCSIVSGVMKGVQNDIKAERDLYKNIILNRLENGEGKLEKVETKVDTLLPKVQESNEALNSIIQKHNRK